MSAGFTACNNFYFLQVSTCVSIECYSSFRHVLWYLRGCRYDQRDTGGFQNGGHSRTWWPQATTVDLARGWAGHQFSLGSAG